jgi:hypothetical protein
MRNRDACCEGAGLFQVDGKTEHHAAVHVDHHGQEGALDRLPVFLVDHNDVHLSVINLGDG